MVVTESKRILRRLARNVPLWFRVSLFYMAIVVFVIAAMVGQHEHAAAVKLAGQRASARIVQTSVTQAPVKPAPISGTPVRIIIPRLAIDVAIVKGIYYPAVKQWSVAEHSANYATNTPLASNTAGTPLIYGHWFDDVFGETRNLQAGDIAFVYTDNGHVFEYQFTGSTIVDPTDTTVFAGLNTAKPGLRLMTCTGTWAQHRRFMDFVQVGVST